MSYETTAVIFLDVLGTKERSTFDEKFLVHQLFHDEFKRNQARTAWSPHTAHTRKLRSFSDCVFIFYQYKSDLEDFRKDDLKLLQVSLYNTSLNGTASAE